MALGLMASSSVFGNSTAAVSGDYCQDQSTEVFKDLYGESVQTQTVFVDASGDGVHYWMKTNLCDGYFIASFVKNAPCKAAHIGPVPNYMRRVWAQGSCLEILPEDLF